VEGGAPDAAEVLLGAAQVQGVRRVRPVLAFDAEIRKVVCSTNAIESVNARIRRAVRARGAR
jgi:transposase-like protein